jgi:alpha-mannosidase
MVHDVERGLIPVLVLVRHMAQSGDHSSVHFPFSMGNAPNVLLETVKHAEDGGSIVLRAHEHMGGKAKADFRIRCVFPNLNSDIAVC